MKKTKKPLKIVILSVLGVILLLGIIITVIAVKELKQEDVLKQEIINYSNMDLIKDDYKINVKTTGDCAYVEEAIKKYFKELSDNLKGINHYLNSDELTNILSYDNLKKDKPTFKESKNTITKTKTNINKYIDNINNLVSEKTIKSLIDKDKLEDGDYYYDLYLNLIYTKQDQKDYEEIKQDMTNLKKSLNKFLDKTNEIIKLLETKNESIEYKDNNVYFESQSDLDKYQKLLEDLKKISSNIENESKTIKA